MSNSSRQRSVKAVVKSIIPEGENGPYAVTRADGIEGSVTFSLGSEAKVWREKEEPKPGDTVLLSKFRQTRGGWRAMRGRFFQPSDEQEARSKEQIMKRINAIIKRWESRFFPSETDEIWREWVSFKERNSCSLVNLIRDEEVRFEFKARALFILLTPDFSLLPFLWRVHEKDRSSYVSLSDEDLTRLSAELQFYVAELIAEFYQYQRGEKDVWDTNSEYRYLALKLLTLLPDEEIKVLTPLFESLAWTVHEWMMIMAWEIDEKWRVMLDQEMRQVVVKSLSDRFRLPQRFEDALKTYVRMVTNMCHSQAYSETLVADQATFIVKVAPKDGGRFPLFRNDRVVGVVKAVAKEKPEDLYDFCSFVVQDGDRGFVVDDEASLQAAELMLEAVKDDAKLAQELQDAILAGKQEIAKRAERLEEHDREQEAERKTEQTILEKMR